MNIYDPTNAVHFPDLVTSLAFIYKDKKYYILSSTDGVSHCVRYKLSKMLEPIHFMTGFENNRDGTYKCVIEGTDGSRYDLRFTQDAVVENIATVGHHIESLYV